MRRELNSRRSLQERNIPSVRKNAGRHSRLIRMNMRKLRQLRGYVVQYEKKKMALRLNAQGFSFRCYTRTEAIRRCRRFAGQPRRLSPRGCCLVPKTKVKDETKVKGRRARVPAPHIPRTISSSSDAPWRALGPTCPT